MKVLLTGATGFLGGEVARELVAAGHDVRVLVRATSRRENIEGLPVEVREGDILDRASIDRAIEGCDGLVHCAASVSQSVFDRDLLLRVNVGGTENALAAAKKAGVKRVVYTSTIGAVGMAKRKERIDESARWDLDETGNHYVASKRAAEAVADRYAREGLGVVILNPGMILGPRDIYFNSARLVLEYVRGRIPGYIDGGVGIVHVSDAAKAHVAALERGRVGERYILAPIYATLEDLFSELARLTGVPAPRRLPYALVYAIAAGVEAVTRVVPPLRRSFLADFNRPMIRLSARHGWYDCSKAEKELGFRATPLEQTLVETLRFHLLRGDIEARTKELKAIAAGPVDRGAVRQPPVAAATAAL